MGLWSLLLVDFLEMIDEQLDKYPDKIRLRCVCMRWQSTLSESLNLRNPQPPCLLMPHRNGSTCGLYHPFDKKVLDIDLPEAGEKIFKGSGHGWVVTVHTNGSINLLNPLSRVLIPLPPRYKFPDVLKYRPDKIGDEYLLVNQLSWYNDKKALPYTLDSPKVTSCYLVKIVLSCSPTCKDFRAVAQYRSNRLAYCKVGDKKWTELTDVSEYPCGDVTFCGGKLYMVCYKNGGEIYVCDDIVSCPKFKKYATWGDLLDNDHLINNSSDNGIMVVRRSKNSREIEPDDDGLCRYIFSTWRFRVFKFDSSGWPSEGALDDEILFMGLGTQMAISSNNFGGRSNGNQIYFACDNLNFRYENVELCFDNGIFSFEDREFKPLDYECHSKVIWPNLIWVTLNPYS